MSGNAGGTVLLPYDDDATFTKRKRGLNVGESRVFADKGCIYLVLTRFESISGTMKHLG